MAKAMPGRMRVGYQKEGYVEKRLVLDLPFRNVDLVRRHDIFNAIAFVERRFGHHPASTETINCLQWRPLSRDVPMFHLVNTISLSDAPWVVTYEHYLPRWNQVSALGWKRLASTSCRKIIAISAWAHKYQEHLLTQYPELTERIRTKMCVIHPTQQSLLSSFDEKTLDPDRIRFTFVGRDFFRKGGLEMLEVFARLSAEGLPVHLTIVSQLMGGDYATRSTGVHMQRAQELMRNLGDNLTYFPYLDNKGVLDLFLRSHVGLLPTYDDTYGFSVLEGQAAGCPHITTDGCALPEMNDDNVGWLIPLPKNELGQPLHGTPEQRKVISERIHDGLERSVREICSNPSIIARKGERAISRVKEQRSPQQCADQLEAIYREALL